MRKPVLTEKASQQNRSKEGAKKLAVLMTLFHYAELQGKNPIETLLSLAKTPIGKTGAPEQEQDLAAEFLAVKLLLLTH
jgi:hypothetical protein